jgi:LytS/YehU family sensor histidine kinase
MPAEGPRAARPGFGLENVRERLRAAYGDTASFSAEHTNAGAFEARLEFPVWPEYPVRLAKEAGA